MKILILKLLIKLLGKNFIEVYLKADTPKEEQVTTAMAFLRAEGMTHRTLPAEWKRFARGILTGTDSPESYYIQAKNFVVRNSRPSEAVYLSAIGLLSKHHPVSSAQITVESVLYRARQAVKNRNLAVTTQLGYQKALADELLKEYPSLPVDQAKAIGAMCFLVLNQSLKGKE